MPSARYFSGSSPVPRLLLIFFRIDGQKAVHEDRIGRLAAAEVQQSRPEQRVEGDDVLADEVVLLGGGVGHEGFVVQADLAKRFLQRGPG
jgi:hypothetical protein